ncbi:MAG: hypothetical protein FWC89_07385 [Defluviitaleaceae bacterium]|nr:hypothetical protein [Defluviitaleaceae bacterium]
MMKKISTILVMIFLVGCTATLGANEMPDETLEEVEEQERTEEQAIREWTSAELLRKENTISHSRNSGRYDLGYISGPNIVPASIDADLRTIERFVFTYGDFYSGNLVVFDRINQKIYFDPTIATVRPQLRTMPYYSNIEDGDLDRLIQVIERSNLLNWEDSYQGAGNPRSMENRTFWYVGILFSDGTIMQRRGGGRVRARDFYPPRNEFRVLTNFINILGTEVQEREFVMTDERLAEIKVQEQRQREWTIEHSRNRGRYDLGYIVRGNNFVSASNDVDFQTIERFVFSYGGHFHGNGFVFDMINEKIYYNPSFAYATRLNSMLYADIEDGDFDRLIKALEKSNIRDWEESYRSPVDRFTEDGGMSWQIGILFSDGTMMRRRGSGDFGGDFYPPAGAFNIITSFVDTLGAEVRERNNS